MIRPILLTLLLVSTPIVHANENPMGCFLAFAPKASTDIMHLVRRLQDIRYEREIAGHDFATDGRSWIHYSKKDKEVLDLKIRILERYLKMKRRGGK